MAGNRPGPKPKGKRTAFTSRFPDDHLEVYKHRAAAAGLDLCDYLAMVLASAHGLDEPEYLHRNRNQPQLLTAAGT